MKLTALLKKIPYEVLAGDPEIEITDLAYDSRKVKEGGIFVCLPGAAADGHDFAGKAVEAGAAALVVEHEIPDFPGVTVVRVPSARKALALLSSAWFGDPLDKLVSVGITGTKGKTTTAHMVYAMLREAGFAAGMIGTNGVYIGDEHWPTKNTTPESFELMEYFARMVEEGCTHMVMEVSSQGIMMDRVYGFHYDYGIFTNLSEDHIGPNEHSSFEEYLSCKSRLFSLCGTGLVNRDDPYCDAILEGHTCRVVTYALTNDADYRADGLHALSREGFLGLSYSVKGPKGEFPVEVNMPGSFNAYNSLAAETLAEEMGLPREAAAAAMMKIRVNGRMEIAYSDEDLSVIIDYAHNAVSMESLLTTLKEYHPKRLVVVFGCGGNRPKERRYAMGESAGRMADLSIVTADNSRWEKVEDIIADIISHLEPTGGKYLTIPDRREAIRYSISHAEKGDLVAIIGKGHEDYQEIKGVRTHFLDREEADAALNEFGYRTK